MLYSTNPEAEYSRESGAGLNMNEYAGMNIHTRLSPSDSSAALNNLNNLLGGSPRLSQSNQELASELENDAFYNRKRQRTVTAVDMDTLYDLPQSLLPHTKHVSRFRRFGKGQIFGYLLLIILSLAFLTVIVAFLIIDQRADSTQTTETSDRMTADVCLDAGGAQNPLCQQELEQLGGQAGIASSLTRHIFDYVFLVIAFVVVLLIFGVVRGLRELRKRKLVDALPGDNIDLWQLAADPNVHSTNGKSSNKNDKRKVQTLRSHQICFNTPMLLSIRDEFQRVIVLQKLCKELPRRLGQKPGDDNWGRNEDGSCYHYQTSIALSYRSLEEFARKYDPSLAMGSKESVRAYVERIKRKCAGIDPNVCDQYVRIYEEAKFGSGRGFNKTKYDKFRQDFANILKFFISRKRLT